MVQQMRVLQVSTVTTRGGATCRNVSIGHTANRVQGTLHKTGHYMDCSGCNLGSFFGAFALSSSDIFVMILLLLFGLLFLGVALYYFLQPVIYRSWHVYVCTGGFVFRRGNKIEAFRWDQIEAMWQAVTKRYTNGIHTGTTHKYTVRRKDGGQVIFNDRFTDVEELGNTISHEITNYQMPQAINAYNAGNTVPFGPLSISMQGISNGKELLPWSQVKDIDVKQGVVTVKKEGKRLNWSSVRVTQVPNVFVLMALINYIMQGQK